ncbi:hypothetical protein AB0N09_42000 [Streptomyces erythrochromogenes]|uniref:hypothetical protein n=1 Tax=Streptomyces erythrochromogenes TaxID=285574 RepID=UPI00341E08A3
MTTPYSLGRPLSRAAPRTTAPPGRDHPTLLEKGTLMTDLAPHTPIPLPGVITQRPAHRGEQWTVTFNGVVGHGPTQRAARADLGAQLATMAGTVTTEPAFGLDSDGNTVVVVLDRPWGIETYYATPDSARLTGTYDRHPDGPAAHLAGVHHYTPLPTYPDTLTGRTPGTTANTPEEPTAALTADHEAAKEHTADTTPSDTSTVYDPAPGPRVDVVLPEAQIHPATEPDGIWRVTWGRLSGLGPDLDAAKDHLMVQVLASVYASQEEPAFARTENGVTIVIARHNGADRYGTNGSVHWLTARYLDYTPDAVVASDAGAVPLRPRQQPHL